ncbi:hypothetical protein PR048_028817 [Dryococelus australis]|uniref:Uncharacterized protein n=1 Tax=Dryococelus australis TaxID=614101 RepID=A0ABQ9GC19_9NEOP|nr:hypothetical protein PR048_028817 [Dryococelus australis]
MLHQPNEKRLYIDFRSGRSGQRRFGDGPGLEQTLVSAAKSTRAKGRKGRGRRKKDSQINDGNFRAFLCFRIDAGDAKLKPCSD